MATTLPMDGQFELDANFFGVPDQTFPEIDLSFYNSSDQVNECSFIFLPFIFPPLKDVLRRNSWMSPGLG